MSYMNFHEISEEQKMPLSYKIFQAVHIIEESFKICKHNSAIAFSGGKDSTALWHLIKTHFPNETPYIIFGNTGVEYPESLQFARKLGNEWGGDRFKETKLSKTEKEGLKFTAQMETLEWLERTNQLDKILQVDGKLKTTETLEKMATPEMWDDFRKRNLVWKKGSPMSYWWCADQYGFPIMGKAASKLDARRINIVCFLKYSKSTSDKQDLHDYYDILRECKISQHCCKVLKKDPSEKLQAELDVDVLFKGLMASESRTRRTNFATRGYIFASERPHTGDDPFYHVNPISIWTDDDIWDYITRYDVPYSPLYDMGYETPDGRTHRIQRNGCYGCCTDILFKNNHMEILHHTHPDKWSVVMKYGMAAELKKLQEIRSNGQLSMFDMLDTAHMLDRRPCYFDRVSDYITVDDELLADEYDSEE